MTRRKNLVRLFEKMQNYLTELCFESETSISEKNFRTLTEQDMDRLVGVSCGIFFGFFFNILSVLLSILPSILECLPSFLASTRPDITVLVDWALNSKLLGWPTRLNRFPQL